MKWIRKSSALVASTPSRGGLVSLSWCDNGNNPGLL